MSAPEPSITINGVKLTIGQTMTIRTALANFQTDLLDPLALGNDAHGREMVKQYRERASEIFSLMVPRR